MRAQSRPHLALPDAHQGGKRARTSRAPRDRRPADADEADAGILEDLKAWRSAEARRRGIPAYIVFHDRTLVELATRRPGSPDSLREVPGIGPSKFETYSKALLEILAASTRPPSARSGD